MIRIRSATPFPAVRRAVRAVRARTRCPAARTRRGRLRRLLPLGVPAFCGAAAVTWRIALPPAHPETLGERLVAGAVLLTVGTGLVYGARRRTLRELRRVRAVAHAAQRVLLRPPPPRLGGLRLAAAQLSASRGASVGGDLYEAVATPWGVRIVIGDVRGHGLPAIGAVAAVLGSFREAAHDEPELGGVLRRLERAVQRHLCERARDEQPAGRRGETGGAAEEFVTVLLLEIGPDGVVLALNCGHPWPWRLGPGARPLDGGEPLPPLGPFPLPAALVPEPCTRLLPGDALFLHTDGAADARDARGRRFALEAVLASVSPAAPVSPDAVVAAVRSALLRHTGGRPTDDAALLVLRSERPGEPARCGEAAPRRTRPEPSRR
jgi:hypothetical protein